MSLVWLSPSPNEDPEKKDTQKARKVEDFFFFFQPARHLTVIKICKEQDVAPPLLVQHEHFVVGTANKDDSDTVTMSPPRVTHSPVQ